MSTVTSEHFGEVELNPGVAQCLSARHQVHGVPVSIELNLLPQEHLDRGAIKKIDYRLRYLPEIVDQVRDFIIEELSVEGSDVHDYKTFHCTGMDAEKSWATYGVTGEVDNEAFVKALRLEKVGVFPGEPEAYFVMEFSLGEHFSDEYLVATADSEGVVDDEVLWPG